MLLVSVHEFSPLHRVSEKYEIDYNILDEVNEVSHGPKEMICKLCLSYYSFRSFVKKNRRNRSNN